MPVFSCRDKKEKNLDKIEQNFNKIKQRVQDIQNAVVTNGELILEGYSTSDLQEVIDLIKIIDNE